MKLTNTQMKMQKPRTHMFHIFADHTFINDTVRCESINDNHPDLIHHEKKKKLT